MREPTPTRAFWWPLAIYATSLWAAVRIFGRIAEHEDFRTMASAAAVAAFFAYLPLFALATRFPLWKVFACAVGACLALFGAVLASTSSSNNFGVAIVIGGAMVFLPIALAVPTILAWAAARYPLPVRVYSVLLVLAIVACAAPSAFPASR
jgi:hypothetical protein